MEKLKNNELLTYKTSSVLIENGKYIFKFSEKYLKVKAYNLPDILKFIDTLSEAFSICKINDDCKDTFYVFSENGQPEINLDNRFPYIGNKLLGSIDTTYFSREFLDRYNLNPVKFVKFLNLIKTNNPELKLLSWKIEILKLYFEKIKELYKKYHLLLEKVIKDNSFSDIYETIYNAGTSHGIRIDKLTSLKNELDSLENQGFDKGVVFSFLLLKVLLKTTYSIKDKHTLLNKDTFYQANEFVCLKDIFPKNIKVLYQGKPSFYLYKLEFVKDKNGIVSIIGFKRGTLDSEKNEFEPEKIGSIQIPTDYYLIIKNFLNEK